jgi:hypothetical protein
MNSDGIYGVLGMYPVIPREESTLDIIGILTRYSAYSTYSIVILILSDEEIRPYVLHNHGIDRLIVT